MNSQQTIVTVIGQGYVGLPLAVLISQKRPDIVVYGYDISQERITDLLNGVSPFEDVSDEVLQSVVASNVFVPTTDASCIAKSTVVIMCVPTPLTAHKEPDMQYIESATSTVCEHIKPGTLVVLESTTYPGTTEEFLAPIIEQRTELKEGKSVFVTYSAERVDPGNTAFSLAQVPKVVSGVSDASKERIITFYSTIFDTVHPVSNPKTAEMTKLLENIYRLVNISLVNELALLSGKMDIDIWEVIEAAKTKPYGFQAFYPGPGAGGHCIPLDPFYLAWKAKEYDFTARFISLAGEVNYRMPEYALSKISYALNEQQKPLNGSRVLMLGVAYKKDIGDYRESPILRLIELLEKKHAVVDVYDPHVASFYLSHHDTVAREGLAEMPDLASYDVVVIGTDHVAYDYATIRTDATCIVDLRNAIAERGDSHVYRL
jgi:UDP-N-acetyl-D-glucosamine dehydrogenase